MTQTKTMQNTHKSLNTQKRETVLTKMKKCWQLYVLISVPILYLIIFKYVPMFGAQIAFKNYRIVDGILGSPWTGFDHFIRFFKSYQFWQVIGNTLGISLYNLAASFPCAIILAISLNYIKNAFFKKVLQMTSYAPHFISVVVIVGMLLQMLSPRGGIFNIALGLFGIAPINFMGEASYFKSIYVWSDIWQNVGWNSIIYLAALSSVDPELHDVATVDGASKIKRIRYIDIPSILPTAIILLIMSVGRMLDTGFQKILLMQNTLNMGVSEVIDTFVYNLGIAATMPDYSYASAVGLFKSVVGLILVVSVNRLAKYFSETSLW